MKGQMLENITQGSRVRLKYFPGRTGALDHAQVKT